MTEASCSNPEEHCDLHACQLTSKERNPAIDKIFENPRFACTNCGAKTNSAENLCMPKEI
ncbi:MAG: hypothetical protein GW875_04240 [Deltaproteobacteria bacterium]|nr:hypothetical protein [Deltaproteobacteria bacterium]NCP02482.1 hypothetical protein [Deltaproteobacteria bacterium]